MLPARGLVGPRELSLVHPNPDLGRFPQRVVLFLQPRHLEQCLAKLLAEPVSAQAVPV